MTVLTGETGAGKTLVVEALQLVLGGKAHASMVRHGSTEAIVEARFLSGQGAEEEEIIVTRSVPAEGRARAWVNGRMSPANLLAEVVGPLLEIHGQHEHQSLVTPTAQRNVLDAFAGTDLVTWCDFGLVLRELGIGARRTRWGRGGPSPGGRRPALSGRGNRRGPAPGPDEEDELRIEEERLGRRLGLPGSGSTAL